MKCIRRILNGSLRKPVLCTYHVIGLVLGAKTSHGPKKCPFLWSTYSKLKEDINNVLVSDMYYKEKQRKRYLR